MLRVCTGNTSAFPKYCVRVILTKAYRVPVGGILYFLLGLFCLWEVACALCGDFGGGDISRTITFRLGPAQPSWLRSRMIGCRKLYKHCFQDPMEHMEIFLQPRETRESVSSVCCHCSTQYSLAAGMVLLPAPARGASPLSEVGFFP